MIGELLACALVDGADPGASVLVVGKAVRLVRTVPVSVSVAAEARHEQTPPAEAFTESAVAKPQALVAHPRALITIEFDIAGTH
jgi:hypothetical protein